MIERNATKNLEAWSIFVCLAKTGSITQAALELDIQQSAVSRKIQALETELGFPLFDRSKRPFVLTRLGRSLLSQIEPLVTSFNTLLIKPSLIAKKSLFRVSAPVDLARDYVPEQLMDYSQMHPEIQFDLQTQCSLQKLIDGSVDALLSQYYPVDSSPFIIRPCISTTVALLATPAYLEAHGVPHDVKDLRNHTGLLQRAEGRVVTSTLYKNGKPSELLIWKNIFIANDQYSLRHLLLRNRGITIDLCPQFVIPELRSGAIIPILKGWERSSWELCVITRKDKENRNPALKQFAVWWSQIEAAQSMNRVKEGEDALKQAYKKRRV